MNEADLVRLRHMLDAAREAIPFTLSRTRDDFEKDRQLVLAVIKCIEIVGEAASKITQETRLDALEIPWAQIVAMRNRLIHGYFTIDVDRVWDTVTFELPPLVSTLQEIVPPE